MSPERTLQLCLARELAGTECLCGGPKKARSSVCYACWRKLPKKLQQGLYQRIGQGYEQAYADAKNHLTASRS